MEKVLIEIDWSHPLKVTLHNSNGTFTFERNARNEELVDFLTGSQDLGEAQQLFHRWVTNQVVHGRTIHKLWKDYKAEQEQN